MNAKYNRQVCWIWLIMSLGVANPIIWDFVNKHDTVEETCRYVQSRNDIKKKIVDVQSAKQLLVDCLRKGIKVVCYSDEEYPQSLRDIHNPPCVLFYRGNLKLLSYDRLLTVVGTRNPSDYTVNVTNWICSDLLKNNFILISGLAVGVDSLANICSVQVQKPTIAVVACGIDYDYPKENAHLKQDILKYGGLILTEQLPDDKPYRGNFPKRNRILAGLGKGTLITEASLGSGALITANYSYKMGKNIFCVPPTDIFNNRYLGVVKYIRDGAICVFSCNDILYEYFGSYPIKVRQTNIIDLNNAEKVSESPIFKEETISKSKKAVSKKASNVDTSLTETEKSNDIKEPSKLADDKLEKISQNDKNLLIIQSLKKGLTYLDDIANDTSIDIAELFELITDLEIEGIVKSSFGNAYILS